jgi:hypothetical protein
MKDDLPVAEIAVRGEGRDADPEIDDPAVLELHRQPVAHLLAGETFCITHETNLSPQRARWSRKGREGLEPMDHSHNPVAHMRNMKIQQEAELESAEAQIAQQLSAMHRQDCRHGFQFGNHRLLHQEIDPVSVVDDEIFVANWNERLVAYAKSVLSSS